MSTPGSSTGGNSKEARSKREYQRDESGKFGKKGKKTKKKKEPKEKKLSKEEQLADDIARLENWIKNTAPSTVRPGAFAAAGARLKQLYAQQDGGSKKGKGRRGGIGGSRRGKKGKAAPLPPRPTGNLVVVG